MNRPTTTEIIDDFDRSDDWKEGAHWGLRAGDSPDYAKGLRPIDLNEKSPEWTEGLAHGMDRGFSAGSEEGYEAGFSRALELVRYWSLACAVLVFFVISLSFLTDCGPSPTELSMGEHHGE